MHIVRNSDGKLGQIIRERKADYLPPHRTFIVRVENFGGDRLWDVFEYEIDQLWRILPNYNKIWLQVNEI